MKFSCCTLKTFFHFLEFNENRWQDLLLTIHPCLYAYIMKKFHYKKVGRAGVTAMPLKPSGVCCTKLQVMEQINWVPVVGYLVPHRIVYDAVIVQEQMPLAVICNIPPNILHKGNCRSIRELGQTSPSHPSLPACKHVAILFQNKP